MQCILLHWSGQATTQLPQATHVCRSQLSRPLLMLHAPELSAWLQQAGQRDIFQSALHVLLT